MTAAVKWSAGPPRGRNKPSWASSEQKASWRRFLLRAQGGLCAGCGKPFGDKQRSDRSPLLPTLDHIVPRSDPAIRWIGHNLDNLLLKHRACNEARRDEPATGCDLVWALSVRALLAKEGKRP